MRLNRVYVDTVLANAKTFEVTGTAANHIAHVLRLRVGEPLTLFDGGGGEYAANVVSFRKNRITVAIGAHSAIERESALRLTLAQGVSRAERMDLVVQKATELGIARIVPIAAARSIVRADAKQAERKLEHWRSVAIAACEQCGRNRLPVVERPATLPSWLASRAGAGRGLLLSVRAAQPLRGLLEGATAVDLLIGPEGGLSPDEEAAALAAGFTAARLGPRTLRTETAAIAALAAIQSEFGDF